MKKPLKVGILGISVDLGLLGHTRCYPQHNLETWRFILRLMPSILLWSVGTSLLKVMFFARPRLGRQLQRSMSHKLFDFLLSNENMHEHPEGYLAKLENKFGLPVEVENQARIGHSIRLMCRQVDSIPCDKDIMFIHLGGMDCFNMLPCNRLREYFRQLLEAVGAKNPAAHIAFIGPPDIGIIMHNPNNRKKALPLPFSPSIADLHRMEGFHKFLKLTPDSDETVRRRVDRYLDVCVKIFQHELGRARRLGKIRSFTFIDDRFVPVYAEKDRHLYFALDGLHMTSEGAREMAMHGWAALEPDLDANGFAESVQRA